ncbi:MAG: thymidine phosphorylase [Alphaproteobacteria bacterium]|nr:thymidine phosphorylase [Alphaproteobacteria bacterium]
MLPQEIIRIKRDKKKLSAEQIADFVGGVKTGEISEGQAAAFCMATLLNKMDMDERTALTRAMAQSGTVLDWSSENLGGPVLDKHSTGGVGDKVSLILAPVVAACGGYVPMLSGRGLGHTGGTLDKMDAIPGYTSQADMALFRKTVKEAGCAIIGATPDLAPADRIFYAIRDVTATVESLDLITASILSKKLASGLDALVMDVKFGSGAFMRAEEYSRALAESIDHVATSAGLPTVALMTDMNSVLGHTAGNVLEVKEAVDVLTGKEPDARLYGVTAALVAELLVAGGLAAHEDEALEKVKNAISSGQAAAHFARMVAALGGPSDFLENPEKHLKTASVVRDYYPKEPGVVSAMNVFDIGIGIVEMGGGRSHPSDVIDHSVGLARVTGIGDEVGTGAKPLATIHAPDDAAWEAMAMKLQGAITVSTETVTPGPLIKAKVKV